MTALCLPDVTLVVLAGNQTDPSQAAHDDTLKQIKFDEVMHFADGEGRAPFRSVEDATRIAWREVYPRLRTSHALSIHWDGYPWRPAMWSAEFREYDFIGAVWPWFTERSVGNTGFSLQSRKLLRALYEDPVLVMQQPEDITLCRNYRPYLESRHGIRFAPEDVADRFSVEHGAADHRSFGFHGVWNMLYFMDDAAIKKRLSLLTQSQWAKPQIDTLGNRAVIAGRRDLYRWLNAERVRIMQGGNDV